LVIHHLQNDAQGLRRLVRNPQGLSRAGFDAHLDPNTTGALSVNTRKTVAQTQLGLAFTQALCGVHKLKLKGKGGQCRWSCSLTPSPHTRSLSNRFSKGAGLRR
jgi:uncharacterized protein YciW